MGSGAQRPAEFVARGKEMSPADVRPPSDASGPSGTIPQAGRGRAICAAPQEVTPHTTPDLGSAGKNDAGHDPTGAPMAPLRKSARDPLHWRVSEMEDGIRMLLENVGRLSEVHPQ